MKIIPPFTIWITGLPASGKTSLGNELKKLFQHEGIPVIMLDGDDVRSGLCADLGYSLNERTENIRRIANVAALLNKQGYSSVCCFVSPTSDMREMAKKIIGEERFIEVFADAPLDSCKERDGKGNYQKALNGTIDEFTGVSSVYEEPENPDVRVDTVKYGVDEAAQLIFKRCKEWLNS